MTEPAFMQNKITCIVCKNQVKYVADSPIYYGHEIEGEQSFILVVLFTMSDWIKMKWSGGLNIFVDG